MWVTVVRSKGLTVTDLVAPFVHKRRGWGRNYVTCTGYLNSLGEDENKSFHILVRPFINLKGSGTHSPEGGHCM